MVGRVWILVMGVGSADQCGTGDLNNGGDDVGRDEDPKKSSRRQWRILSADPVDHDSDESVDGRREEDWCDDNEEVLDHKVRNRVGVSLGRQATEYISDDLHDGPDNDCREIPCSMFQRQIGVSSRGKDEEDGAEYAEGERWTIAVLRSVSMRSEWRNHGQAKD